MLSLVARAMMRLFGEQVHFECDERCFGVLKARFRCLLQERVLCYDPVTAGHIINSCIILHNIMILNGLDSTEEDDIEYDEELEDADDNSNNLREGIEARNQLVNEYFNN